MLIRTLFIITIFFINYVHAQDKRIHDIDLANGFKLVPYQEHHKEGFKSVVNDPGVYPHIRHGQTWTDDLIDKRHAAYLKGNQSDNTNYDPATFLACWVLIAPNGEVIGRGGFQDEDGCQPVATEPFFAIKGSYQHRGLGKKVTAAIGDWFVKTVGSDKLLRCLTMKDNIASQKLAKEFGFKPRDAGNGQQLVITNWGKEYLVFERGGKHELR